MAYISGKAFFSFQGLCINEFRGSLLLAGDAQSNGDGCPPDVPHLCKTGEAVLDDMFNNGQSRTQDDWERVMMENFLKLLIWLAIVYTLGCIALTTKGPKFLILGVWRSPLGVCVHIELVVEV